MFLDCSVPPVWNNPIAGSPISGTFLPIYYVILPMKKLYEGSAQTENQPIGNRTIEAMETSLQKNIEEVLDSRWTEAQLPFPCLLFLKIQNSKDKESYYQPAAIEPRRTIPLVARKKYLRKNTESNISNQAFSFLCSRNKSSLTLMRLLGMSGDKPKGICHLFYAYISVLKRHRTKYLNKKMLSDISTNNGNACLKELLKSPVYVDLLPIDEFCRLTRILLRYFLTNLCPMTIITSKKLSKDTREEHFRRRRQIICHCV